MAPARVRVPEPDLVRLVLPVIRPEKLVEALPERVSAELLEAVTVPAPERPPRTTVLPLRLTVAPEATLRALVRSPKASVLATVIAPPETVTPPVKVLAPPKTRVPTVVLVMPPVPVRIDRTEPA